MKTTNTSPQSYYLHHSYSFKTIFDDLSLTRDEYGLAHLLDEALTMHQTNIIDDNNKKGHSNLAEVYNGVRIALERIKISSDVEKILDLYPPLENVMYPQDPVNGYPDRRAPAGGDWGQFDESQEYIPVMETDPQERDIQSKIERIQQPKNFNQRIYSQLHKQDYNSPYFRKPFSKFLSEKPLSSNELVLEKLLEELFEQFNSPEMLSQPIKRATIRNHPKFKFLHKIAGVVDAFETIARTEHGKELHEYYQICVRGF